MDLVEGQMSETKGSERISTKQHEIAELARREPKWVLTTLSHRVDLAWLREAYRRVRKDGKRNTVFWCAPALAFLPVKIEHREKDGTVIFLHLRSQDGFEAPTR